MAELIWGQPRPSLNHTSGLAMLAGLVAGIGIVGSYSEVLIRKFLIRYRAQARTTRITSYYKALRAFTGQVTSMHVETENEDAQKENSLDRRGGLTS